MGFRILMVVTMKIIIFRYVAYVSDYSVINQKTVINIKHYSIYYFFNLFSI
jgi:hypothetical protein